jgi:hypothetical protein
MQFLRQSTASQEVLLGPFVSDTDFKTPQTGLTILNTDILLWKSGATSEVTKNSGGATHISSGRYYAVLDATDTNTVGMLEINVVESGALPVKSKYYVLTQSVYDSLFGSASTGPLKPAVDNRTLDITATGAIAFVDSVDTVVQNVGVDTIAANAISSGSIAAGALNGKGDWSTQNSVDTLATYVDTEVAAIKAKTDNLPSDPADASDISASFVTVNNTLATIAGYVDTEVAAIKAKTDLIPADIGSVLVSTNVNQREVAVTGSHHIAADVHEFQPGVITAADFAAGAIDANALAADAATEIANAVAATQALSRLDSMIESNGSGQFRFDTIALSMGAGGGGSATINVYPVTSSTPERVNGTTLVFYLDESRSVSILTDFTLTSLTLEFVVEDMAGNDIYSLSDGQITKSSQTATLLVNTTVTSLLGQYKWSLRDITSGNSVIARGILSVQDAASANPLLP